MVASADSDLYSPFPHNSMPEEPSGPSSEEGSGLHSPIFGGQYAHPHGDSNRMFKTPHSSSLLLPPKAHMFKTVRYHPEQVDIQNAAGILASQFDYNGLSNISVQQGPLLDASLDPTTNGHHHRSSGYPHDYQLPPSRNQLGLDIPTQTLSNTRLPPPPTAQGGDHVYFNSSPDRQYSGGGGYPTSGMPMDGGHQGGSSSSAQQQPQSATSATGNSAATSQEPRKETSGVVIACRQW